MSQRSHLEDKYTLICLGCKLKTIDPTKKLRQKYAKVCKKCGRTNKDNYRLAKANGIYERSRNNGRLCPLS